MKIVNAKIKSASLRNGCGLYLNLELDLQNGYGTCFGFTCLGNIIPAVNIKNDDGVGNYAAYYIEKIFEVAGVDNFGNLNGMPLRAIFSNDGCSGDTIIGLQHFLDDSIFFIPSLCNDKDIDLKPLFANEWVYELWQKHKDEWKWSQRVNIDIKD